MEYEDRITIATPEGVDLELTLAGLGSRFTAALVDSLLQVALMVAAGVLLVGTQFVTGGSLGGGWTVAVFFVVAFLILFGYHTFFEVLASGRTPGKRWTGLRVVRVGGHPVTFTASAVRNVVRLVDWLPSGYVIGATAILVTPRNQRLGDIAAGTLVVRERLGAPSRPEASGRLAAPRAQALVPWDVSAVTVEELAAVRGFLERRFELTDEARGQLAVELAERLRPKVAGAPDNVGGEAFLESLAAAKAARA